MRMSIVENMDQQDNQSDFEFYQQAVSHISGSLDLGRSMISVFDFLKEHFPIEGISLHQYSKRLQALKLLFLVTKDSFQYVETILPLSRENSRHMFEHENSGDSIVFSYEAPYSVSDEHRRAVSHLLPYRPSSYMVGIMRSGDKVVGHLCFIGAGEIRYTEAQKQKMRLLLGPFNLAMSNMLKYKRVMDFQQKLHEEKNDLEKALNSYQYNPIIGDKGGLHKTMDVVRQLEGRDIPVLILGETGTGKELIADAVQKISPRKEKPFIKVNCGAIPDNLIDSELFGYEKGAFTGAVNSRPGRFEQADGGTLFLDEVGELPPQAQVRLLRVLQNNVVERIGGKASISVDVRIIAATNRNLSAMLQNGSFREDLYYRLYVFPIQLPALRERVQDIPALIHHFIKQACIRLKIEPPPVLHPDSMERLRKYTWPGNVRELENIVERAVILSSDYYLKLEEFLPRDRGWYQSPESGRDYWDALIDKKIETALGRHLNGLVLNGDAEPVNPALLPSSETPVKVGIRPLEETIKESIRAALVYTRGRVNGPGGAADLLKLNPSTLRNKMRKLKVNAKSCR